LSSLRDQTKNKKLNKFLKKQIRTRRDYLFNQYKNYKFYFTVFMGSRGRLYFTSAGSYFGLQTGMVFFKSFDRFKRKQFL